MATARINGVRLHYQITGEGEIPLVMVHGAWVSHRSWEHVVPRLARSFRVVTYDRRGHSASERPAGPTSFLEHVRDLAGLIEHLGVGPAWVAGNSSGSTLTLRLAAERPDLVQGVIVHEPALFGLLEGDPQVTPMLQEFRRRAEAVVARIRSGDHAGAAEQFVETVALGPGHWAKLPEDYRQVFIENAPTFVDDIGDPESIAFDLSWLRDFDKPVLLSRGDQSPPAFGRVLGVLEDALPEAEVRLFDGAGHVPQRSHPAQYADTVTDFIRAHAR